MEKQIERVETISFDEDSSTTPPRKTKKIWYEQCFNIKWLSDPEFKDWLQPHKCDRNLVICSFCDVRLKNPNRYALSEHASSQKHEKNKAAKQCQVILLFLFSTFFLIQYCFNLQPFLARLANEDGPPSVTKILCTHLLILIVGTIHDSNLLLVYKTIQPVNFSFYKRIDIN